VTLEGSFYEKMRTDAGISALVSNRIFPDQLPQKVTLPAISYQRIAGQSIRSHSGAGSIEKATIQVSAWAKKPTQARAVAQAVIDALNGQTWTEDGTKVSKCFKDIEMDHETMPGTRIHGVSVDFVTINAE